MFTFTFEKCQALVSCNHFCKGWGLIATLIKEDGTKNESVKVFLPVKEETLPVEIPDFNSMKNGELTNRIKAAAVETLRNNPVWRGKNPAELLVEANQDLTVNCYEPLIKKYEDSRLVFSVIRSWADEFEIWWWSLTDDEQDEKDYLLSVDEFSEKKLREIGLSMITNNND